ncbi:MAG: fused MFS/spermidine synthase [Pleurocapsa sp. MO_226.B13]|nr:fused MFS/spermidine synthase [Pleurocapsa sp. MO_226.B13]
MKLSATAIALLFFSGLAALIYQTLWVKQLALVVGVDVYAVTIGVSAFFAGLALGNFWFGRRADRATNPWQLYVWLEIGIAVAGVGATGLLAGTDRPFVFFQDRVGLLAWLLPFLLVGLPATLMGGTLVVLFRACQPEASLVGKTSGLLYAANTAGAIAGTLATSFYLIPHFGLQRTAWVAAMINLGLALAAWLVQQNVKPIALKQPKSSVEKNYVPLALAIYTLAGGLALGYEVIWTQAIVQFLSTRTYAFTVVLATYLLGLTLGSWLYAYWADRIRHPWQIFGILLAGAGISALVIVTCIDTWLLWVQYYLGRFAGQLFHNTMAVKLTSFTIAAIVFVLLPTILLGAAYPLAIRLAVRSDRLGSDAGLVTALNTVGGIIGTGVTGFVLIPRLGLVHSLAVLTAIAIVLGAIAILREIKRPVLRLTTGLAAIGFIGLSTLAPSDKFAQLLTTQHRGELVFYQESAGATVAVVEQPTSHGSFHRLYIQGVSNTGDAMPSLRYMRLQALLPLLIHPGEPRSAMVVGLGSGITSGSLLTYPDLEKRVAVELLPAVVEAASSFNGNFDLTHDSRLTVQVSDGRHELLRTKEEFDLITLEPPPPSASGVVNLYSQDFYELCKAKLAPNGLLAQWWPLATQNDEDSRSLVRSLLDTFPYVSLWSTELHEMMVIGSQNPLELNHEQISDRYYQPTVQAALAAVGIDSPQALLATYVTDRAGLEHYVGDAPPVTDDRPLIEYAGWLRSGEFSRVLPRVMASHKPVPLAEDDPWNSDIEREQYQLWNFYQAGLAAYQGQGDRWWNLLARVLQADPDNLYYQWFVEK